VRLNWIADFDVTGDFIGQEELANGGMWRVTLKGDPSIKVTMIHDKPESGLGMGDEGVTSTSMSVIHAIPYMVEKNLVGIQTYNTLPPLAGRYAAR
jgi:hypothetical protein